MNITQTSRGIQSQLRPSPQAQAALWQRIAAYERRAPLRLALRACLCCVALALLFCALPLQPSAPGQRVPSTAAPPPDAARAFAGVTVLAYAARPDGAPLCARAIALHRPIALQVDVTTPLAGYSPLASSVPGLPLCIAWSEGVTGVRVETDGGDLLLWDIATGIVTPLAQPHTCTRPQTLYVSPLDASGQARDTMRIHLRALRGQQTVGYQEVIITCQGGVYFATLGPAQPV
nr:hypothetical protein [Maliibacterium massiliense]